MNEGARQQSPVAASIRARLLNESKRRGEQFEYTLVRFASERLLYRIGVSPYRDSFILKGATLFAAWAGSPHRPTRDIDLLAHGDPSPEGMTSIFRSIVTQDVAGDGLVFDADSVRSESMREDEEYTGLRIRMNAQLGSAVISVQIDLGFGDVITPGPVEAEIPTYLNLPAPQLRAYPRESLIAEKVEAMVSLGITNSRLKDFYDLLHLSRNYEFNGDDLAIALKRTFERRGTSFPDGEPVCLTNAYTGDSARRAQWRSFLSRNRLSDSPSDLSEACTELRSFVMPLLSSIAAATPLQSTWRPSERTWT